MDRELTTHDARNINIFLVGIALYSIALVIARSDPAYLVILAGELIQFLGICFVVYSLFAFVKLNNTTTPYVKFILALLLAWFYFLIAWSLRLDFDIIKRMLLKGEGSLFTYLIPLVVFAKKKVLFLKNTVRICIILGIIYFVFLFLYKDVIFKIYGSQSVVNEKYFFEYCVLWLSITAGIILLLYPYFSRKVKIFALIVVLVTLVTALFRARRTLIFISVFPLLLAGFLYILNSRYKLLALIIGIVILFGISGLGYELYTNNQNGFFSNLTTRIDEDTRTGVNECFYNDFIFNDWIIGRGFEGRYFCPNIDDNYEVVGYRSMIETDFLNIILKSGGVYLFLLLSLMIPAVYKGWFQSKNLLSKAAASWIFFWIICLYPANVFAFSFNYLLVWLAVGICFSERIRLMPEETVKRHFKMY
ncbi:hypothetical protein K8352_02890 [Flavobacteriaceae bacterium F89]|uniref:Uncharacterized protein n=1 Tax=Cerina litoralis TaxID=2874477 RepID=A0AAE3ERC0_9FLAO|nr:hypothetical protein [Cerina litoralis]MCG2459687.1 hypothetical protein [Cerina litoralis]